MTEVSPTIDLEVLERLAAEATPGPWYVSSGCELIGDSTVLAALNWHSGRDARNEADAAFLPAANPQVVAALVAAVKAALLFREHTAGDESVEMYSACNDIDAALQPFTVTK